MTMFNEAELIRQLEEQRAVIVQKSAQVNWLQTEKVSCIRNAKSCK